MVVKVLGNKKLLERKEKLKKADEQLLLIKIVNRYIEEEKLHILYNLLTGKELKKLDDWIKIAVEGQPLTHRVGEGNTYLDLAMGSIRKRENTESGIELDSDCNRLEFVFCEAKWKSDLSIGVSRCSIRNQLQRIIENSLIFAGEKYDGKIFVTLITPKIYKKHYDLRVNTRFYACKYREYSSNLKEVFLKELDLIRELGTIPFIDENEIYDRGKNQEIVEKNLDKLILNWVTFEELLDNISDDELKKEYQENNKEKV